MRLPVCHARGSKDPIFDMHIEKIPASSGVHRHHELHVCHYFFVIFGIHYAAYAGCT